MFGWFKNIGRREYPTWKDVPDWNKVNDDMKKITDDMSKVVPFPELKVVPPMPEVIPPKEDHAGRTCYSIGLTDDNRVSLTIGYSSFNMNSTGVRQLIDQLSLFKSQIEDNEE
jgi:hypothetical protein